MTTVFPTQSGILRKCLTKEQKHSGIYVLWTCTQFILAPLRFGHRERALLDENAFFRGDISIPKSCLRTACEHLHHPDVPHLEGRTERELLSLAALITPTGCQARRDGASRFTVLYAFLINGKRIDDLAEGSDNNM